MYNYYQTSLGHDIHALYKPDVAGSDAVDNEQTTDPGNTTITHCRSTHGIMRNTNSHKTSGRQLK